MPLLATEMVVTGQNVADFLGRGDEPPVVALAEEHAAVVTAMARAYTRGRGFDSVTGAPNADVYAVIVVATARLVTNPAQAVSEQTPMWSRRPAVFAGWTLAELFVLNSYRKRSG